MKARTTTLAVASGRHLFRAGMLGALMLLITLLYAGAAWAATFTVTNTSDSGAGSLRAAIEQANSSAGADQIVFADGVSGTITLGSQLPIVTDAAGLTIDGGGDITVSGNNAVRIFEVGEGAKLTLKNLTIANGFAPPLSPVDDVKVGGGILNRGTLEVINSTLSDSSAIGIGVGGGIANLGGVLTVTNSTLSGNSASTGGGAIFNDGPLKVIDSTLSGNTSAGSGGGAILNFNILEVTNSTLSGNSSRDCCGGGAIFNWGTAKVTASTLSGNSVIPGSHGGNVGGGIRNEGTLKVIDSTLSGNTADGGGAIANSGSTGTAEVINSTLSGNTAGIGGGILNVNILEVTNSTLSGNSIANFNATTMTLRNTIVANSPSGENCLIIGFGPIIDAGYNIDSGTTCGFTQATGSLSNTNPLLDPAGLQDNGGPTQTIALLPESPAVDLVGEEACPPPETDQRGVERPQGEACDSGAFELEQQAEPTTKAECKNGGYKEFGFKNQGRCIAFVNRTARTQ